MSNNSSELNDLLFDQLKRLTDDNLSKEDLEKEVARADAVVKVSDKIIDNANIQLKAADLYSRHGTNVVRLLPSIGTKPAPGINPKGIK